MRSGPNMVVRTHLALTETPFRVTAVSVGQPETRQAVSPTFVNPMNPPTLPAAKVDLTSRISN